MEEATAPTPPHVEVEGTLEKKVKELDELQQQYLGLATLESQGVERVAQLKALLSAEEARVEDVRQRQHEWKSKIDKCKEELKDAFIDNAEVQKDFLKWLRESKEKQSQVGPDSSSNDKGKKRKVVITLDIKTEKAQVANQEEKEREKEKEKESEEKKDEEKDDAPKEQEKDKESPIISLIPQQSPTSTTPRKRKRRSSQGEGGAKATKKKSKTSSSTNREAEKDDVELTRKDIVEFSRAWILAKTKSLASWRETRRIAKNIDPSLPCEAFAPPTLKAIQDESSRKKRNRTDRRLSDSKSESESESQQSQPSEQSQHPQQAQQTGGEEEEEAKGKENCDRSNVDNMVDEGEAPVVQDLVASSSSSSSSSMKSAGGTTTDQQPSPVRRIAKRRKNSVGRKVASTVKIESNIDGEQQQLQDIKEEDTLQPHAMSVN